VRANKGKEGPIPPTDKMKGNKTSRLSFFPIWYTLKHYSWAKAKGDMQSAFNTFCIDFPQSMAYAMVANLPIQFGLYSAIVASFVCPIFASKHLMMMMGPTTATSILTLSTFLSLNFSPEQTLFALPILVFMVGILLILGAFFGLSGLSRYVSRSVTVAYLTAVILLIILNQFGVALGCKIPKASTFMEMLQMTCLNLHKAHWPTILLSLSTAAVYFNLKKYCPRLPLVGTTLIIMAVLAKGMNQLGASFQMAEAASCAGWDFTWPVWDWDLIRSLGQPAIALALVITLDSANIAKTLASQSPGRPDLNQQMLSMGITNIASAVTSGMVVSGSLMRSQLNITGGAKTVVSSMSSGLILLFCFLVLSPYFQYIPKPTLSVLIIIISVPLIRVDMIKMLISSTVGDAVVFFLTFFLGLVLNLESSIYIGAAISIIFFLKKVSVPQLLEYDFNDSGELCQKSRKDTTTPEISIVHVEGDLFFGAADIFLDQTFLILEEPNLKVIILRLRNAHHLDASTIIAIKELLEFAREKKREVIICDVLPEIEVIFRNSGLIQHLGEDNFFSYVSPNPNWSTREALKRAQVLIGAEHSKIKLFISSNEA
jgi:sulfate permease, SulP family